MKRISIFAALIALALSTPAAAQAEDKHDHDHQAKAFATVSAGLAALDETIAKARALAAAGNIKALHDISEDLHGIADGLRQKAAEVEPSAMDRFKFNVDQVENLHEQLEAAHESASKENIDRVIKRLEDVAGRLKALVKPAP